MTGLRILREGHERRLGPSDFPVPLGGPGSAVPVAAAQGPLAWLGLEKGEVFVQPSPGSNVRCNGARLAASHWLRDGDVLRLATTAVEVRLREGALELGVTLETEANPTEPPVVLVPPPRSGARALETPGDLAITPIPYVARPLGRPAKTPRGAPRWLAPLLVAIAAAAAVLLLLSRLALVRIEVQPAPDAVALRGAWPAVSLGARTLALTGGYTLVAEKAGYRRLEAAVAVEPGAVLRHALVPLPGRLAIETPGLAGAEVAVDGAPRGTTPLAAFEVEAGERELLVRAKGYEDHAERVAVAGRGTLQSVVVTLVPLPTPAPGPAPEPRPGIVSVTSDPAGAQVRLDGVPRGTAPVELRVRAGVAAVVAASLPGHASAELTLMLRAGERRLAALRLEPQLGAVTFAVRPPDAQLLVDGQPRGRADQTLELLAIPHQVEIRREGYAAARVSVTPRPGFAQTVSLALESTEERREQQMPRVARSPEGHELRLVSGRRIAMGAPRREPGRRANEQQREVELARPFYVAAHEVSNAEFRRYLAQHASGSIADQSLDVDTQPVVNVTWQQAAAYCNWLSDKQGLPRAYVERDGTIAAAAPLTTGYRLPTEAEWERVARYPGAQGPLKYPWGAALPVPPGAGNYADMSAAGLVARVIEGYDDGFRASAPVTSFAANALGLYHLGDNVAEWAHDWYALAPSAGGGLERDPSGPAQGEYHVIRGASYLHASVTELRLSFRDYGKQARPDVGFRIARYAQ